MRYTFALLILLLFAPLAEPAAKKKKITKPQTQTIAGCVDEKSSDFVLRTDDMLKELAALEPVGFEKQNFARFVGHKVSVSGELITTTQPPTIRVTSLDNIKNISDICAP